MEVMAEVKAQLLISLVRQFELVELGLPHKRPNCHPAIRSSVSMDSSTRIPDRSNETPAQAPAATQPSPRRISPIILVIPLRLLPPLDKNLGVLPIQLLSGFENHIQGSLGALLRGQICHVAATELGFHPLIINKYMSVCRFDGREMRKGERTPGLSAMNENPSFSKSRAYWTVRAFMAALETL